MKPTESDFSGSVNAARCVSATAMVIAGLVTALMSPVACLAELPSGTPDGATNYYRRLSPILDFSTPDQIFQTHLDDVATYLGYDGLTGRDMQDLSSALLMNPQQLLQGTNFPQGITNRLEHPDRITASLAASPLKDGDILVTRFFAPKIMDIRVPEQNRKLGWRKLARLRARPGSAAEKHHIAFGVILFNFAVAPGTLPFAAGDESKNTQVMLVTELASIPQPNSDGPPALYWLDYKAFSVDNGTLSLALDQTFDADELTPTQNDTKSYYVPDGCVACHGSNPRRALLNYLDTDHWFDRLETDFPTLKASGQALLFDAQTNDSQSPAYRSAFDVITAFNREADAEVRTVQPKHPEALASGKWLEVHTNNYNHVLPTDRAIGNEPRWSGADTNDVRTLAALNQYCFRCHGTVKFSVFDKQTIRSLEFRALIEEAIRTNTPPKLKMPTDRPLPDDVRALLHNFTQ